MIEAQVRAVADDLGVDAVKIGMLGSVATIEAVGAGARRAAARHARRARSGDGRGVRGAAARPRGAGGARASSSCRARPWSTPNVPEARALIAGRGGRSTARSSRAPCTRSGARGRGRHRRPSRGGDRRPVRRRAVVEHPRGAPPRRRGARLGVHALLRARGAARAGRRPSSRGPRGAARRRPTRCATDCGTSGAGAGPVNVLGSGREATNVHVRTRRASFGPCRFAIIARR